MALMPIFFGCSAMLVVVDSFRGREKVRRGVNVGKKGG